MNEYWRRQRSMQRSMQPAISYGQRDPTQAFIQVAERSLGPYRAQLRSAKTIRDPYERLNLAASIASAAARLIGVPMPRIQMVHGDNAHADHRGISMGIELVARQPVRTLAEILLHEAGHAHEGHTDIGSELVARLLLQAGLITERQFIERSHNMEHAADLYAAIGAWMFDPAPVPGISIWLQQHGMGASHSHPDSFKRARMIQMIVEALDTVIPRGFLA